jgi:hypothetical protein
MIKVIKPLVKLGKYIFEKLIIPIIVLFYRVYYFRSDKKSSLPKIKSQLLLEPAHVLALKIRQKKVFKKLFFLILLKLCIQSKIID